MSAAARKTEPTSKAALNQSGVPAPHLVPVAPLPKSETRPIEVCEEQLIAVGGAFQASAHDLVRWAMSAEPQQACIYARVTRLSRGGVGERARMLHAAGLVVLLPQRPSADMPGLFEYRVRRTTVPFRGVTATVREDGLRPDERMLLDLLSETADAGERCRSNRDLAALLGLKREDSVTRLMGRLSVGGHIAVSFEDGASAERPKCRVVTILSTGKATYRGTEAK